MSEIDIGDKREHGHENGRGGPEVNAAGVEILFGAQFAQLALTHAIDALQKVALPRVEFDDANSVEEFCH